MLNLLTIHCTVHVEDKQQLTNSWIESLPFQAKMDDLQNFQSLTYISAYKKEINVRNISFTVKLTKP